MDESFLQHSSYHKTQLIKMSTAKNTVADPVMHKKSIFLV